MLSLVGRVPETDVAVRTTTLSHFTYLVELWIGVLEDMDPYHLANVRMLEPIEGYLARMETEALIAMCHPCASVRIPAVQLLGVARTLAETLTGTHSRMVDLVNGDEQKRQRKELKERQNAILAQKEAMLKAERKSMRASARTAAAASKPAAVADGAAATEGHTTPQRRGAHAAAKSDKWSFGNRCSHGTEHGRFRSSGGARDTPVRVSSPSQPGSRLSRMSKREASPSRGKEGSRTSSPVRNSSSFRRCRQSREEDSGTGGQSARIQGTARSAASSRQSGCSGGEVLSAQQEEVEMVDEMLKEDDPVTLKETLAMAFGKRVQDVLDDAWDVARMGALRRVLSTTGDHALDADSYGQVTYMSLTDAAANNHSVLWGFLLVEIMQAAVDGGCAGVARNVRRSLRKRLLRLPTLSTLHTDRQVVFTL